MKTKQNIMVTLDIALIERLDKAYTNRSGLINDLLIDYFKVEDQKLIDYKNYIVAQLEQVKLMEDGNRVDI